MTASHEPTPARRAPRLAVLLSGSGRTLVNLAASIADGRLHAVLGLVIASRDCPGVLRAHELGIPTLVMRGEIPPDQLEHLCMSHRIDLVVLAGYLRLLPIPPSLAGRVVNIHPALLPAHGGPGMYGHHVHEAVMRAGDATSGCTVHYCDDQYDRGGVILQRSCPVLPDDTPDTLAARVFELECQVYPEAIAMALDRLGNPAASDRVEA